MTTSTYSTPILSSFPPNALTTTFSPPASCSGIYSSAGIVIIDPDSSCLPDGFSPTSTSFFSPGLVCPSGYATACNDNAGVSSITTVTCCPYRDDMTLGCVTPSTLSGVWETLFCTWIAPETGLVVQITASNDGTTSTEQSTMVSPDGMNAFGIRMVYEASDVSSEATTTTTSGQSSATSPGSGATATNTSNRSGGSASGSSDLDDSSNSLSIGAVAAVAVVIPIVVIGAAAGMFLCIRKRKQAQRLHSRDGPGVAPGGLRGDQKGCYGAAAAMAEGSYYDPKSPGAPPSEVSGVGAYGNRNQYQEAVELGEREPAIELPAESYR